MASALCDANASAETPTPQNRRPAKACLQCRKRKVKCPGGQPCLKCTRTKHDCIYDDGRKVFVSESLETGTGCTSDVVDAESRRQRSNTTPFTHIGSTDDNEVSNPLTTATDTSVTDVLGGYHFIGTSSTWGFAWRARQLLRTLPNLSETYNHEVDDVAHARMVAPITQDARLLPQETSNRYLSNYAYHIAPLWYFCQHSRYSSLQMADSMLESNAIIHAQFNLIMAIGKLLEPGKSFEEISGEAYFWFALSIMQNCNESQITSQAPLLIAQNYCLIAFYFHAINMRNDAYINVGKASRIVITQGLHRISQRSEDSTDQEARVRFWWSLYSLDMTMSSLMGGPVPIHANEITTRAALPHSGFLSPEPVMQLVKIARLTADTLSEIYGNRSYDKPTFVRSIVRILEEVEDVVKNMPFEHQFNPALGQHISRTTATLHLSAYQIIILAVRPIVFHAFERRVTTLASRSASTNSAAPSRIIRHFLKQIVDAATKICQIFRSLAYQSQLQVSTSFDVTTAFSAAVILALATFISSGENYEQSRDLQEILSLLRELGSRGNGTAQTRFVEMKELMRLLSSAPIVQDQTSSNTGADEIAILPDVENNFNYFVSEDNACDTGSLSSFVTNDYAMEDFNSIISQIANNSEIFPFLE